MNTKFHLPTFLHLGDTGGEGVRGGGEGGDVILFSNVGLLRVNSEVTKWHAKGDDDIKFWVDWFHRWIEVIKMKLPNSMNSQVNVRIVKIE